MSNGGSYDPHSVESDVYRFWEAGGYFHGVPNPDKQPYVIDIPLPNVTGALHLGHAINNTLQDALIRYKRMCGYETMWMPGMDHAGIATQAVVEKRLKEEQNLTRHEIGRDGLVKKIWEWKEDYGGRILAQLRKMGVSCDWDRTRFTLDEVCAKAVYEVFFRWFQDGLIYRGNRLVNWDAHLQTAVADDEIVHETVQGHLWHYRYPIEGGKPATDPSAKPGQDYLVIATTRPETMLGDTAVAVHPDDERYTHLIGKRCILPLVNRPIPIIADSILVKPEFGTGCVKVTPAHDPNDYEFGLRHDVPMINILAEDGAINENGGAYAGLDRYDARVKVVEDLEQLGLMEKIEDYETEVGHSDRSKTPIEPMLSEQWFVRMGDLADLAMDAVRDGRVQFFPGRYAKTLLDWLGEKRDWCISRQLWWGHRIPVWTLGSEAASHLDDKDWVARMLARLDELEASGQVARQVLTSADRSGQEAGSERERLHASCWCPRPDAIDDFTAFADEFGFERDPDVLDTWFSSALWPFSTLKWPDANADLEYFYPTSVLVTGRDIITLWVARMIITGLYFTQRVPFSHVYIHPNIQDGQGRRMSKSLGNGVDPLDIIELYGTDALRYTMASIATETQDARLPVKRLKLDDGREINTSDRFEPGRNFCNKLWQATTGFVMPNLDGYSPRPLAPEDLAIEDRWIISRLAGCIEQVEGCFAQYQTSDMASVMYSFFWGDLCDWYIELVKPRLFSKDAAGHVASRADGSAAVAQQVLVWVLDQTLRLLHPIIPFVTEALWQKLGEVAPRRGLWDVQDADEALIIAAWPGSNRYERAPEVEREMAALQEVIRALRDTLARVNTSRSAAKMPAIGKLPQAVIRTDAEIVASLQAQLAVLQRLGRCEALDIGTDVAKPAESAAQVLTGVEVYVPLSGLMDLAAERKRLEKERDGLRGHIERLRGKLANEGFVSKAPVAVVERERQRLGEMKERYATLERNLADLGG